ncbi:MAG: PAS domain S-box protein [Pirellulales bacterium]
MSGIQNLTDDVVHAFSQYEDAHHRFVDLSGFPVFCFDAGSQSVIYANHEFCRLFFGVSTRDSTIREIQARIDPDQTDWPAKQLAHALQGRVSKTSQRVLNHAGRLVSLYWRIAPVQNAEGVIVAVAFTAIDVTGLQEDDGCLPRHDARWRSLLKHLPGELLLTDRSGNILFHNNSDERTATNEPRFRNAFESIDPGNSERAAEAFRTAWDERRTVELEVAGYDETGETWTKSRLCPILDDDLAVGMIGFGWDVTEAKIAQLQLSGHNTILEMISRGDRLEPIFDRICSLASQFVPGALGTVLLVSPDGRRAIEVHAPSFPQEYVQTVYGVELGPDVGSCGPAIFTGKSVICEDITQDPRWQGFQAFAGVYGVRACWSIPFRSLGGQLLGTLSVYFRQPTRSTEKHLALLENLARLASIAVENVRGRELLAENKARYRAMLENSADALMTVNEQGVVTYDSPNAGALLGYPRGYFSGKTFASGLHPDDVATFRTMFEHLVAQPQGTIERTHLRTLHANGDWRILELSATNALSDAALRAVILNWRDVTLRADMEEQLRGKQLELAHAARLSSLGEMIAGISHEVNQPLYAIKNYGAALQTKLQDDRGIDGRKIHDWLNQILKQAERAGEILTRLRTFSKKSPGKATVIQPNDVARDALNLVEADPKLRGRRIQLELEPCLPELLSDRVLLQQVLVNLLQNALDATENPETSEATILLRTARDDGHVVFEVIDQGVGIGDDALERVFDPFFTTKEHGMGLGLSICRSIVEASRGRLTVRRNADRGCCFTCRLPTIPADTSEVG